MGDGEWEGGQRRRMQGAGTGSEGGAPHAAALARRTLALRSRKAYCSDFSTRSRAIRMQFLARPLKPLACERLAQEERRVRRQEQAAAAGGTRPCALRRAGCGTASPTRSRCAGPRRPGSRAARWRRATCRLRMPGWRPARTSLKILSLCISASCCWSAAALPARLCVPLGYEASCGLWVAKMSGRQRLRCV